LSTTVGRLVEVASGQSLADLAEHITEPLGMRDTFFYVPDDKVSRLAVLYTDDEGGGLRPIKIGDKIGNNTSTVSSARIADVTFRAAPA